MYCSEDPSTALLETLVHLEIDSEDRPKSFQVLKVESAGEVSVEEIDVKKLGSDWRGRLAWTRGAGDEWLQSARNLLLQAPSVLVPERHNYLINPAHPEMRKLRISARYRHSLDQRLLR